MRFGRTVERGFLPVFSVDTEEQARDLLIAACPTNLRGDFVAPELVHEQTLPNLHAFGDRLERRAHDMGMTFGGPSPTAARNSKRAASRARQRSRADAAERRLARGR